MDSVINSAAAVYSLVQHLAMIAGGREWKKVRLTASTGYFDASGDNSCQFVVAVCGFVASAGAWIAWQDDWLARLKKSHRQALHMKDLDKTKDKRLICDLAEIIRNHVERKFGVVIVNREIVSRLSKAQQQQLHVNSYALAGRTVATDVRSWSSAWALPFPEMIFEKGDAGANDLRHLMVSQGYPEPQFRPKKSYTDPRTGIVHHAAIPLQAADLLANLVFCNIRESALTNTGMARLPDSLEKIPGDVGRVEAERYAFIKQVIEEMSKDILIPGVKVNVRAGESSL